LSIKEKKALSEHHILALNDTKTVFFAIDHAAQMQRVLQLTS